jgi:hypothetical protein
MTCATFLLFSLVLAVPSTAADRDLPAVAKVDDFTKLPANSWTLIHVEDDSGGKWGARAIYAPETDRLYDPAIKHVHGPIFSRPFGQEWGLALCTTPRGVYATTGGTAPQLYKATVTGTDAKWELVDGDFPKTAPERRYNYEFLPLVYDSKRDRLIHTMGGGEEGRPPWFQMHARGLGPDDRWERIEFHGITPLPAREIVYLPKQDALLALLDRDNLYAFHCETNEWKQLDVALPEGSYRTECSLDYDPVHDVAVALIPEGFSRRLKTLLFRYDPNTARYHHGR